MYIHDIHNICTVHIIIIYGILWWYVRPYTCIYMIYVDICIPSTDNIKHYSPTSARQFIWVARTSVLLVLGFFCDAARSIWGCPNAIPGKQGNMMTYCEIYMTHIYIEKWWQCIGILGTVPHPDPSAETQLPESHACFLQKQMRTSGRCDRCIVGVELQLMWQAQSHKHQWRCLLPVFCKVMGDGLWMHMNYKVYFSLQLVFTTSMIYGSFGMSICFPFKYMKTILFIFMHVL